MHIKTLTLSAAAALLLSCGNTPSSPGTSVSSPSAGRYPEKGVVHWRSFLEWDDAKIEAAAGAKMIIFPIQICLSQAGDDIIGRLKSINPEIKIVGYLGLLNVSQLWADTATVRENTPYEMDFYNLSLERWAWTTTGDTLSIWPGSVFLNPFRDGSPDIDFIVEIVDLIERYRAQRESSLDGIMHDYFMYKPYINYQLEGQVEGEVDLDGNGIAIGDDPAERSMFLEWQIRYAGEIRSRFGPDFIQVGNGRVPQENAELAGFLNGIYYEYFPNMCWSITDREGMRILVANQEEGYLDEAFGRTWSILTNEAVDYNNYFCLITSMLAGCLYTELHDGVVFSGWQIDLQPGTPRSGLMIEGSPDSVMTYRRAFSRGEARISFASFGGRTETRFIENE